MVFTDSYRFLPIRYPLCIIIRISLCFLLMIIRSPRAIPCASTKLTLAHRAYRFLPIRYPLCIIIRILLCFLLMIIRSPKAISCASTKLTLAHRAYRFYLSDIHSVYSFVIRFASYSWLYIRQRQFLVQAQNWPWLIVDNKKVAYGGRQLINNNY